MNDLDARLRSAAAVLEDTGDRINHSLGLTRTPPRRPRRTRTATALVSICVVLLVGALGYTVATLVGSDSPGRSVRAGDGSANVTTAPLPASTNPPVPNPDAPVVNTPPSRDGCTNVVDHSGTVRGCVLNADLHPLEGGPADKLNVYDADGNLVGYFVAGSVGYVDRAEGDDPATLADIQYCFDASTPSGPVSPHCAAVLTAHGVQGVVPPTSTP